MSADMCIQNTTSTLNSPRQVVRLARSDQSAGHAKPLVFFLFFSVSLPYFFNPYSIPKQFLFKI